MKFSLINVIVFVIVLNSDASKPLFRPQLPIGEYEIKFLAMLRCQNSIEKFKFNLYLTKTSINTTEIRGNLTFLEPIDDSFSIEVNMAVKDSVGGFKDNAHVFRTPNACSSIKMFLGTLMDSMMDTFEMQNYNCPFPAIFKMSEKLHTGQSGCYKTSGIKLDTKFYKNIPKQFFYGTYKFNFQVIKNKVLYGCFTSLVEVKRPWKSD